MNGIIDNRYAFELARAMLDTSIGTSELLGLIDIDRFCPGTEQRLRMVHVLGSPMADLGRNLRTQVKNGGQYRIEAANVLIALGLGLIVVEPSNYPDWKSATDARADAYGEGTHFLNNLDQYANDFAAARSVAPIDTLLSLEQKPDRWIAGFYDKEGYVVGEVENASVEMAIVLAAIESRIIDLRQGYVPTA